MNRLKWNTLKRDTFIGPAKTVLNGSKSKSGQIILFINPMGTWERVSISETYSGLVSFLTQVSRPRLRSNISLSRFLWLVSGYPSFSFFFFFFSRFILIDHETKPRRGVSTRFTSLSRAPPAFFDKFAARFAALLAR